MTEQKQELKQVEGWKDIADILAEKKEARKEITGFFRVLKIKKAPLEYVMATAQFYELITEMLATSPTRQIYVKIGEGGETRINAENLASDVCKLYNNTTGKATCAQITEKGAKLDAYLVKYRIAKD